MVISDKYKYLFVELYNTGSTTISNELCELYEGTRILRKHSRYHEFLRDATKEQKKYFVFSGIRNPMDSVVTEYLKFVHNHKGKYTDSNAISNGYVKPERLKLYKDITENQLSFQQYFMKYFKLPYDKWTSLDHANFDYVMRYENLQDDFTSVLKKLNIEEKRKLPKLNKTEGKEDFSKYYTPDIRKRSVFVFGPFLEEWDYSFPPEWNIKSPTLTSKLCFNLLRIKRKKSWKKKGMHS